MSANDVDDVDDVQVEQAKAVEQPNADQPGDMFVWPPKEPEPKHRLKKSPIQIRLPSRMIESIETHLLGRTSLAFDRWALQTGWTRDDASSYCWRCGSGIGLYESDGEGCASCREKKLYWDRAIRLGKYGNKLREEVLALKFAHWRPTGTGLGLHLGHAILDQLEHAQIRPDQAALVPIPMHRLRRIARGVDHTLVIARGAAQTSGCQVHQALSSQWRPEQVGLSMTARAENIKDAFFFSGKGNRMMKKLMAQDQRVFILIDDVRTTGATFVAASKALKTAIADELRTNSAQPSPVEIWIACVGVAEGLGRRDRETEH